MVAAPPRASPDAPVAADEPPNGAAAAQTDGSRLQQADDIPDQTYAAKQPAGTDAARLGTDAADDDQKVHSVARRSASPLRASPLRSGDAGQAASQPPAETAARKASSGRSVVMLLQCICHVIVKARMVMLWPMLSALLWVYDRCRMASLAKQSGLLQPSRSVVC